MLTMACFNGTKRLWDFLLVCCIIAGWGISSYNIHHANIILALAVYMCDAVYLVDTSARMAKSFPDVFSGVRAKIRTFQWRICSSTHFLVAMYSVLIFSLVPYHVWKIASRNSLRVYFGVCIARCCRLMLEGRPRMERLPVPQIPGYFSLFFAYFSSQKPVGLSICDTADVSGTSMWTRLLFKNGQNKSKDGEDLSQEQFTHDGYMRNIRDHAKTLSQTQLTVGDTKSRQNPGKVFRAL